MNQDRQRTRVAHCCCGSLRADVTGEPEVVGACSCGECQRRTGSIVSVNGYWLRQAVKTTGPASCFLRKTADGRRVTLFFCPTCGSTVYWESNDLLPDMLGIAAGTFFDPEFPLPQISVWEASRHPWLTIPSALHFETQPVSEDDVAATMQLAALHTSGPG